MGDEKKSITLFMGGDPFTVDVTRDGDSKWSGHLDGLSGGSIDLEEGILEGDTLKRGTVRFPNGDLYEGDWKNGERDGQGKLTYADGAVYGGEFSGGNPSGKGTLTYSDGKVCEGELTYIKEYDPATGMLLSEGLSSGGKRQGWGRLVYASGDIYDGDWKDGERHGHGALSYASGDIYEGDWKDGEYEGHGALSYANGDFYRGDWKYGEYEGHGTLTYANGDVYDGDWKDGKREGHGTLTYANGDVYDGDWKDGECDGPGKLTYASGAVYEGKFSEGHPGGKGEFTYSNGSVCKGKFTYRKEQNPTTDILSYEGLFSGRKRQGWGKLIYADGDIYEGEFSNGECHGYGKLTCAGGAVYEGEFSNGEPQGKGKLTYADGDVWEGEFSKGKRQGYGKLTKADGEVYEGEFSKGKRHGYGKLTKADGKVQEGEFSKGRILKVFSRDPENGLNYYETRDSLGRLTLQQLLSGEPERDEYKKVKTDVASVAKLKPLFRETRNYGNSDSPESENVEYFSYREGGILEKRLEVNYDKINRLLSSGEAKNLEDLVAGGALVVRDGADTQLNISAASAAEIKEFLLASVKDIAKLRSAKGAKGFSSGRSPEYQATILSMVEGENLRNVRFSTGKTSYSSMTSFLESMGIDKENLKKTEAKYISLDADTDLGDHAVCLTVDLEKIRKDVEAHGWDELNKSTGTYVLCFDSSRIVGYPGYKGNFGKIGENLKFMNKVQQKLGSCWYHSEASVLTTVENPRVMEKMFSEETKTYGLGEEGNIGDPNEIMVLQMQKLQSVANTLGVNLKDGRFLVEGIVQKELIKRVAELAKDEALLEDLDKRIEEVFETFEKELEDKNAGVEDKEYKDYKEKITEEHRKEIKNISSKEKAGQSSEFVENLKKLEEVNRQINNLENRLKAGLEKFGEGTNNVKIVDILEMNDREKEDKEKKEKEEKEKKEKEEKERKKREKNEKEKEKEKEKDTLDPFDDYLHSYEDKIETGAGAETGGMDRTNDVSQSLVIGVFAGRCSTSPEQQGTSVSSSNATQQANINTNTKETSFS